MGKRPEVRIELKDIIVVVPTSDVERRQRRIFRQLIEDASRQCLTL